MAKHDENKDLRSIAQVCRVNHWNKSISYDPNANIGIRRWGRIDYLIHYCGWSLVRLKGAGSGGYAEDDADKVRTRESKRANKEHKLTDKTKRNNGKRK